MSRLPEKNMKVILQIKANDSQAKITTQVSSIDQQKCDLSICSETHHFTNQSLSNKANFVIYNVQMLFARLKFFMKIDLKV